MITDFIGKTVNFNTLAPAVLGGSRKNVTVTAVLDLSTALLFDDVRAKHTRLQGQIPDLPASASLYMYIKVTYTTGATEVLGVPWIDLNSMEVVSEQDLVVRIKRKTLSTETTVRQALLQNGIDEFTIEA